MTNHLDRLPFYDHTGIVLHDAVELDDALRRLFNREDGQGHITRADTSTKAPALNALMAEVTGYLAELYRVSHPAHPANQPDPDDPFDMNPTVGMSDEGVVTVDITEPERVLHSRIDHRSEDEASFDPWSLIRRGTHKAWIYVMKDGRTLRVARPKGTPALPAAPERATHTHTEWLRVVDLDGTTSEFMWLNLDHVATFKPADNPF